MATLNRYDKEKQQWTSVASSNATGVHSVNQLISYEENDETHEKEPKENISVEEVLVRHEQKLDKHTRNINWLALHGGGGSGTGSSGSSGKVTIKFRDNESQEAINTIVYNSASTNILQFSIEGRSTTYKVGFKAGKKNFQAQNIKGNTWNTFTLQDITNSVYFVVTAVDVETNEEFSGQIYVLVNDLSIAVKSADVFKGKEFNLNLRIKSSIPYTTSYIVKCNNLAVSIEVPTSDYTINIPANKFNLTSAEVGQKDYVVEVVNQQYSAIQDSALFSYNVINPNEVVVQYTISNSSTNKTNCYAGKQVQIPFKVIYGSYTGSCTYWVYVGDSTEASYEAAASLNQECLYTFTPTYEQVGNLTIKIKARYNGNYGENIFYLNVTDSGIRRLELSDLVPKLEYIPVLGKRPENLVLHNNISKFTGQVDYDSFDHRLYGTGTLERNQYAGMLILSYTIDDFNEEKTLFTSDDGFITVTSQRYIVHFNDATADLTGTLSPGFNHIVFAIRNISPIAKLNITSSEPLFMYVYLNGTIDKAVEYKEQDTVRFRKYTIATDNLAENNINKTYCNIKLYELSCYEQNQDIDDLITIKHEHIVKSYINNYVRYKDSNIDLYQKLLVSNGIKIEGDTVTSDITENGMVTLEESKMPDYARRLNIPIVYLDIQDWSFTDFTGHSFKEGSSCTFKYYEGTIQKITNSARIEFQGTSSLAYTMKNLMLILENQYFKAIEGWGFENQFTLKADVVDSAHFNNALIGKFINEYYKDRSFKTAIEGFPVLVYARFQQDEGTPLPQFIGIYSFNLGRTSLNTMGLANMKYNGKEPIAPELVSASSMISATTIYPCYEGANSDYSVYGSSFFWETSDYKDLMWKTVSEPQEVGASKAFDDLLNQAADWPYYRYNSSIEKKDYYITNINGQPSIVKYSNETEKPSLRKPQTLVDYNIDKDSVNQYYVLCMFFGLIDSLGKNMWLRKTPSSGDNFVATFYDLDTALKLDNNGYESVRTDLRDFYINPSRQTGVIEGTSIPTLQKFSIPNADEEPSWNDLYNESVYFTVSTNKLFALCNPVQTEGIAGILTPASMYGTDAYVSIWNTLRTYILDKYGTVSDFVEKHFEEQVNTIGQMMYNFDFERKYIGTSESIFLHGTRINTIKKWLKQRMYFLDSLYGIDDVTSTIKSCIIECADAFSPVIKTICPTIIRVIPPSGSSDTKFFYINEHWDTQVQIKPTYTTNKTQSTLYGCNLIKELPDDTYYTLKANKDAVGDAPFQSMSKLTMQLGTIDDNGTSNTIFDLFGGKYSLLEDINFSNNKHQTQITLIKEGVSMPNIATIDITNSAIQVVRLPQITLFKYEVEYSALREYNLLNQPYISSISLKGCTELEKINIGNSNALRSIQLDASYNLNSLTGVVLDNNKSLESINITNSNLLSCSITGAGSENEPGKLKTIKLQCPNLQELIISNVKALETLDLNGCRLLSKIYFKDCDFTTIKNLNISYTKLKYFTIDDIDQNCINLKNFINLENFHCAHNEEVEYIELPNNQAKPVSIKTPFTECLSLKRIYGYFEIATNAAFYNCVNFRLHGNSPTYKGRNIKSGNRDLMPYEMWGFSNPYADGWIGAVKYNGKNIDQVTPSEWNSNIKVTYTRPDEQEQLLFQEGDKVTNIKFSKSLTNVDQMFHKCTLTNFEIYYIMSIIPPTLTSISGLFSSITGFTFDCNTNSIDRYIFYRCHNVVNISGFTVYSGGGSTRYYSPENDGTQVLQDNGVLSPLINTTNCTYLFQVGIGESKVIDRFLLRRKYGKYKFNIIPSNDYSCLCILDVNNEVLEYTTGENNQKFLTYKYEDWGDYTDFLKDTPKYNDVGANPSTINCVYFNITKSDFKFIKNKHNYYSLNASRTQGTLTDLTKYFSTEAGYASTQDVKTLYLLNTRSGYDTTNYNQEHQGTIILSKDSFKAFVNVVNLQVGNGLHKYWYGDAQLTGVFDYNPKLESCPYLFAFMQYQETYPQSTVMNLPGNIFVKDDITLTPNLKNIEGLFYGIQVNTQLTGKGFVGTNLVNVVSTFANLIYNKGSIPYKLLFLGYISTTFNYNGANERVTLDTGAIQYIPLEESLVLNIPKKTIVSCQSIFKGTLFEPYKITDSEYEPEDNEDYYPFIYKKEGSNYIQTNQNLYKKTYIWQYDGVLNKIGDTETQDANALDEVRLSIDPNAISNKADFNAFRIRTITDGTVNYNMTQPLDYHFCMPPDVFRYCTANCSIQSAFECVPRITLDYGTIWADSLTGRIVPYLLKPLPETTSITSLFKRNNKLSGYLKKDMDNQNITHSYIIPESFFQYCPKISSLKEAFVSLPCYNFSALNQGGNTVILKTNYDVFNKYLVDKESLDLTGIFSNMYDQASKSSNLISFDGIFNRLSRNNIYTSAFRGSTGGSNPAGVIHYYSFNSTIGNGPMLLTVDTDGLNCYIFYGHRGVDYDVTKKSNTKVSTARTAYNFVESTEVP